MSDDDLNLESTELKVGGIKIKGVYVAAVIGIISSASGIIWAAAEFYGRVNGLEEGLASAVESIPDVAPLSERVSVLEDRLNSMTIPDITALETNMASSMEAINTLKIDLAGIQIPDLSEIETNIATIETQLEDNNIGQLQGKLTELSTSLAGMMEQVRSLIELRDDVAEAQRLVNEGSTQIANMELQVREATKFANNVQSLQREVDDLWEGMDALANPLR